MKESETLEVIKEEGEVNEELENEIELSTNFPRKRIGCCRCPVNLKAYVHHLVLYYGLASLLNGLIFIWIKIILLLT